MAYVPVPKDMNAVKTKVNAEPDQAPAHMLQHGHGCRCSTVFHAEKQISSRGAAICMVIAMLPFFLLAMYEKTASR
jgi:hypothetical protein